MKIQIEATEEPSKDKCVQLGTRDSKEICDKIVPPFCVLADKYCIFQVLNKCLYRRQSVIHVAVKFRGAMKVCPTN